MNNKKMIRNAIINFAYAIILTIYILCFNILYNQLELNVLERYIQISSISFLGIAIVMFEIAYRKKIKSIGLNGIEFFAFSVFILLIQHMPKILESDITTYMQMGIYIVVSYYIIKIAFIYTNQKREELKSLSDIKEIVKDEPIKKETKRKNKKVEEEK